MNAFFGKVAQATMIAMALCLVASSALANDRARPWKGHGEAVPIPTTPCDWSGVPPAQWRPGAMEVLGKGILNATHIGLGEITSCTVLTGFEFVPPGPPASCSVLLRFEGSSVITAANGDEIHTSTTVRICLNPAPGENCETHVSFLVSGGTGRFEDATGEIHAVGIAPYAGSGGGFNCVGPLQTESTGTIAY